MINKSIVVAGVSGCGKSTVANQLSKKLGWTFLEADDFHDEASKAKMASGQALNDQDRAPWLARLNVEMQNRAPVVLACSALKAAYRVRLSENLAIKFIWLDLDRELAIERVGGRKGHFMPTELVDSQFATAEIPDEGCLLYTSPSPRDATLSRMPSSA